MIKILEKMHNVWRWTELLGHVWPGVHVPQALCGSLAGVEGIKKPKA